MEEQKVQNVPAGGDGMEEWQWIRERVSARENEPYRHTDTHAYTHTYKYI